MSIDFTNLFMALNKYPMLSFVNLVLIVRLNLISRSVVHNSMFPFRLCILLLIRLMKANDIIFINNSCLLLFYFICLHYIKFRTKDVGDLYYFSRIQVVLISSTLFLSQAEHIYTLVHRFHLCTAKSIHAPLPPRITMRLTDGE